MAAELVLSLAQSYLTDPVDHVNSQLVSKYLHKTGREDPTRHLPPLGWTIENSRKKRDKTRLQKHASELGAKQVYLESELPQIHEELMKTTVSDILGVNMSIENLKENQFTCKVTQGVYIPVMYPRQKKPIWSMIFSGVNHTVDEMKGLVNALLKMKIHGLYHSGISEAIIQTAQTLISDKERFPDIEDHPNYARFVIEAASAFPFDWYYTTLHFRWSDLHSNGKSVITHG